MRRNAEIAEIIEASDKLEMGSHKSVEIFMQKEYGYDWHKNPWAVDIMNNLKAIMECVVTEENGIKVYRWQCR